MELTAEQFSKLTKVIYRKLGLMFDDKKIYLLNKRVQQRITLLGLKDADEYLFQLGYCDTKGDEMQALANLVTTNETYMFREFEQLAGFADVCLPELVAAKLKTSDRRIRIWCAGCSSGEEAYTLAIIVREVFPDSKKWDVEITATDIDENMLQRARNGVYDDRAVKGVPDAYRKHLLRTAAGFTIDPDTSSWCISRSSI
jgi:chemotaxis protein methyltransferase CheR